VEGVRTRAPGGHQEDAHHDNGEEGQQVHGYHVIAHPNQALVFHEVLAASHPQDLNRQKGDRNVQDDAQEEDIDDGERDGPLPHVEGPRHGGDELDYNG